MKTAIVLAGGLGTRLRSITQDVLPKPMVPVQEKPFLYWLFRYLHAQKITNIILAVSHRAEVITQYFENEWMGIQIQYSFEYVPMGTGGAIRQAMELTHDKQVFVINGDTYFPIHLSKLKDHHEDFGNDITLAVKLLHSFDRYGTLSMDSRNRINAFHEKKFSDRGYINGGIYCINRATFIQNTPDTAFSIEKEVFEKQIKSLKIGGYKCKAGFIDIGIPEDYHAIQTKKLR